MHRAGVPQVAFQVIAAALTFCVALPPSTCWAQIPRDPTPGEIVRPWIALANRVPVAGGTVPLWELEADIQSLLSKKKHLHAAALVQVQRPIGGLFGLKETRSQFIESLRVRAASISQDQLVESGIPVEIARRIAAEVPRPWLRDLQEAAIATAPLGDLLTERTARALRLVKDRAVLAGVRLSRAESASYPGTKLFLASTQARQIRATVEVTAEAAKWLEGQPEDTKAAFQGGVDILKKRVATEARGGLADLAAQIQVVDGDLRKRVLNFKDGVAPLFAEVVAVEQTIARFKAGGDTLKKVDSALDGLESELRTSANRVVTAVSEAAMPVQDLSRQIRQVVGVARVLEAGLTDRSAFETLAQSLGSGSLLPPQASKAVRDASEAVDSLRALSNSQAGFGGQAQAALKLVGILAPEASAGLSQVLNQAAPIMAVAGPLLALSGFGAALPMFGPGGGSQQDPETARALAEINEKLAKIDKKLDKIYETMVKNHLEVMEKLDAIHFDIRRLHTMVQAAAFHDRTSACLNVPGQSEQGSLERALAECNRSIASLMTPQSVSPILLVKSNLKEGADEQWAGLQIASRLLAPPEMNCGSLFPTSLGAPPFVPTSKEMGNGTLHPCEAPKAEEFVEPSLLAKVAAADIGASFGRTQPRIGGAEFLRWRNLLLHINRDISQEAVLSGLNAPGALKDALLDQELASVQALSQKAFGSPDKMNASGVAKALAQTPVALQNAARSALRQQYEGAMPGQAMYALAYYGSDPWLLQQTAGGSFKTGAFSMSPDPCFTFGETNECVPLPKPKELQVDAAAVSSNYRLLTLVRGQVLGLIEQARLYDSLSPDSRERLIELVTLNLIRKARSPLPVPPAS